VILHGFMLQIIYTTLRVRLFNHLTNILGNIYTMGTTSHVQHLMETHVQHLMGTHVQCLMGTHVQRLMGTHVQP
jgi:hypothetical protein